MDQAVFDMSGDPREARDDELAEAAAALAARAAAVCWRGPDPYDALFTAWPAPVVGGRRRRQAIVQLHARAPVDLRRLYRRSAPRIAKALALFATADLRLTARGEDRDEPAARARRALDLLYDDREAGLEGWGYPFDVQTRWSFYRRGTPNIVVTSYAAVALNEAGRELGVARYVERSQRAARWVLEHLRRADGVFVYHPSSREHVLNASLLGARLVVKVLPDHPEAREAAAQAVDAAIAGQRSDGAFPYGQGSGLEFVDSFHTGFILDCLADLVETRGSAGPALERGAAYYIDRFFGPGGESRLWPDREFPQDAHAAGTAMTTLSRLARLGLGTQSLARRVANWTLTNLLDGEQVVPRRGRFVSVRARYLRWCDAHVALGMADVASMSGAPLQFL